MSSELNIGSIVLPPESATKTFAILAKRGAGKSYTAAVLAEEFYKANIPFVVFDPIDVWWGLRVDKDGESKGLPVVVFGLEHADIPLERTMGKQIAQAIVSENVNCVISTFGMPKNGQRELMSDLAEELLRINNTPRHIFIEEAHEFVPQRVFGAMGKVFNSVSNLVVMGRNRGIGVTLINQRAATINKDVLTQIDNLLAFRNIAPQDRKALKEWVEYHAADGDFEEFMKSLPSLPTGEGWLWSPEFMEVFTRIKIRERETFHPDREKLGQNFIMPHIEQGDIQSFINRFKSNSVDESNIDAPEFKSTILELSEEHRQELNEKDRTIEILEDKLKRITAIVSNGDTTPKTVRTKSDNSPLDFWLTKLPTGSGKILNFLADKYPMKFSRSQLALLTGFNTKTLAKSPPFFMVLKKNNLIREIDKEISINEDLLQPDTKERIES